MNRGYLALGAAFVLAAVVGLYFLLGKDTKDDALARRDPADPKIAEGEHATPRVPVAQPARGEVSPSRAPAGAGTTVSEYPAGNVRVRDHRSGNQAPVEVPPPIHPPEGPRISSHLTFDLSQRLRAPLTECAAAVPSEARGAKPYLGGEILIAIKNHQATITGVTYQTSDVTGEAQASFKQCMEQKTVGVAVPSGDEPDVEGYAITLQLRLP